MKKVSDEKLLEEGRRLKREVDADYETLYSKLTELGSLKRKIMSKESALRSIQERLLSSLDMPVPTATERARRKHLREATDDDTIDVDPLGGIRP